MKTLTIDQKNAVSEALKEYLLRTNCKADKIAYDLDFNEAYISRIRTGQYKISKTTVSDKYFTAVAQYIGFKLKKEYWQRCDTTQSLRIYSRINEAKEFSVIRTIIGDTGVGKTYTVDGFVDNNKENKVYRITVGQLHTIVNVIDDLLVAMKLELKGDKVSKLRRMQSFLSDLSLQGWHPLIIIDEAENLKLPIMGLMKQLYDDVVKPKYCGVVLIGTSQLSDKIMKMTKRNKIGVPQFWRRIKAGMETIEHSDWFNDPAFMFYLKELVGDTRILTLLKKGEMACNYGEVNDYIEPAMRDAERLGEEFNYEFFCRRYRLSKKDGDR